ncbi:MAG: cation:proton antiporter, partial [Proteobacteria bacterium]|nr:cation:proton antiporter [Pseudomonadota bacterium]
MVGDSLKAYDVPERVRTYDIDMDVMHPLRHKMIEIILDILPLRDYFSSIFFISIGMLLNIGNFLDHFSLILGITLILVVMKVVSGFLASVAVGNSARISFIVGVRLAQVGEFSLILAGLALTQGLLSSDHHQTFLTVAVLTMLIAPLLIQVSSPAS